MHADPLNALRKPGSLWYKVWAQENQRLAAAAGVPTEPWPDVPSWVLVRFPIIAATQQSKAGYEAAEAAGNTEDHDSGLRPVEVEAGSQSDGTAALFARQIETCLVDLGQVPNDMSGHEELQYSPTTRTIWDIIFNLQVGLAA